MLTPFLAASLLPSGSAKSLLHRVMREGTRTMWNAEVARDTDWMEVLAERAAGGGISDGTMRRQTEALLLLASKVQTTNKRLSTILFHVPSAAVSGVMQRHLFAAYPHDRHLFAYDGLARVVARSSSSKGFLGINNGNLLGGDDGKGYPLVGLGHLGELVKGLEKLNGNDADAVESWIAAVDGMIGLKEDTEPVVEKESDVPTSLLSKAERKERKKERERRKRNPIYLPFVIRLGYLREDDKKAILYLTNLMQFLVGARSREVNEEEALGRVLKQWRKAEERKHGLGVGEKKREILEECAFASKRVLLADKILVDTVQPAKEWSLKAAKKLTSCACCLPENEEEYDDLDSSDEERGGGKVEGEGGDEGKGWERGGVGSGGGGSMRSGWSDGSAGFAFDPDAAMRRVGRRGNGRGGGFGGGMGGGSARN